MNTVPRILDDKSANKDEFVESTHEVLAEKLYSLIANTPGSGYTIGLEGKWGSGKSTIVEILCGKLKKNNVAFPFYIDAWEHEGDSLRRMFLGLLIQQLLENKAIKKDCGAKLEDIQKKVNSKQSAVTVSQSTSMLMFGKIVAALLFLVPFGTVIVENTLDDVTIGVGLPIHRRFCLGLALILAPLFAYLVQGLNWAIHWLYYKIRKILSKQTDDNGKDKKMPSFSWFDAKAELQTTDTTTEETEKDSVEFAAFFSEIMKSAKGRISKLVIIVDNLDRINHHDALKIWSALQTFIHCQREDAEPQKWILVPYAEEGMKALWDEDCGKKSEEEDISVGKSFLDKNFQLRFEVPDLLIGDWQEFVRTKTREVFDGFSEKDQTTILDVLCWARRNSSDAPSPREIKLYLNQVRLLLDIHSKDEVQLSSICFYATQRYLRGKSRTELESKLLKGDISSHSLPLDANNVRLVEDLCAILFHVSPEKGIQILLEDKIKSCLEQGKEAGLKDLFQAHGNAFVGVLGHILSHAPDDTAFTYALAVQEGLVAESEKFHDMAISHWRDSFPNYRKLTLINVRYPLVIQFGSVVRSDSNLAKETWDFFSPLFRNDLVERNFTPDLWENCLSEARQAYGIKPTIQYSPGMLPMIKQCNESQAKTISSILKLSSDAEDTIANDIQPAHELDPALPVAFSILIDAGLAFANNTFNALNTAFSANSSRGDQYFQMIACLDRLQNNELRNQAVVHYLKMLPLWNIANNPNRRYAKNLLAYLTAKYCETTSPQQIASSLKINQNLVTNICSRWKASSLPNAEDIYQLTHRCGDYSYIKNLAVAPDNALIGDIIRKAIRDNDLQLGRGNDVLGLFSELLKFLSDEERNKLALLFITAENIVNEFENIQSGSLATLLPSFVLLIENMKEDTAHRVRPGMEHVLLSAPQEEWKKAFDNLPTTKALLRSLIDYGSSVRFSNAFCEAFKDWLSARFKPGDPEENLNHETVSLLFQFLGPGFKEDVAVWINQLARGKSFLLRPIEAKVVLDFGADDKWMDSDGELICSAIQNAVINKKNDELIQLVPILVAGLKRFNPSSRFSSILKEPVEAWIKDAPEDVAKSLHDLCSALNIKLDPPPPSCDNPKP